MKKLENIIDKIFYFWFDIISKDQMSTIIKRLKY